MDYTITKDAVVVSVVLLLIGIAIIPGITGSTSEEIPTDAYVDFTTEVCGLSSVKPQTIKLTRQQADDIEAMFYQIHAQLDASSSTQEAVRIFTQAVVELNTRGLLDATDMDDILYRIQIISSIQQKLFNNQRFQSSLSQSNHIENKLCLIIG